MRIIALFSIILLATASAYAAPRVNSVSGNLLDGEMLTIAGSEFGVKETAAPLKYDNFDDGTVGSTVEGWGLSTSHNRPPIYSNDFVRTVGGPAVKCLFDDDQFLSSFGVQTDYPLRKVYIDAWYLYDPANPPSRNHKIFRFYSGMTSGYPNLYFSHECDSDSKGRVGQDGVGEGNYIDWNGYGWSQADEHWIHIQGYFEESSTTSDDGLALLSIDNEVITDEPAWRSRTTSNPDSWHSIWFGNYMGHGSSTSCERSDGASFTYWDDVYVDVTQARVEIGDTPVYDACTHREIQIPQEWTSGVIKADLQTGAFLPGQEVFVFVIDESGNASPGYGPLLLGGDLDPGPPGQAGKPYRP